MTFQIELLPSGKRFECEPDETVLQAALRQNVVLPYGCRNGACGSCKATLVSGEVDPGVFQPRALPEADRVLGKVLLCCAQPQSDLGIQARELSGAGDMPIRKMPCRVNVIEKPVSDVAILRIQLPANEVLQYRAGQYIEFLLRDGQRRSYSMANAPAPEAGIELHIRHMPGGVFTDHVFGQMKEREILRLEGPLGSFFLREESNLPIIMLASGTGFAPIKGMIEYSLEKSMRRPIHLYWGGRREKDLYMADLARQWAADNDHIHFIPVLSDVEPGEAWAGRTGFVHQAVMQDFADLSGFQVYACGAPVMVDAARRDFTQMCGLPEDAFFADSFTSAADLQG